MKTFHIRHALCMILFLVLIFLSLFCTAEDDDSYISKRYPAQHYDKVNQINTELAIFPDVRCELLETALIGDHLLQVLRFIPINEHTFLYPIGTIKTVHPTTSEEALAAVIGEDTLCNGMPTAAYGKTVSAYLEETDNGVLFVDLQTTLSGTANRTSFNEWVMQDNGAVIVYTWIWPLEDETEKTVTIHFARYTSEELDALGKEGKRFSTSNIAKWQFKPDKESINIPVGITFNNDEIWESEDKCFHLELNRAQLHLMPKYATLSCDIQVFGIENPQNISLTAKPEGYGNPIFTYTHWNEGEDELRGRIYCMYVPTEKVSSSIYLIGTINNNNIQIELQQTRD